MTCSDWTVNWTIVERWRRFALPSCFWRVGTAFFSHFKMKFVRMPASCFAAHSFVPWVGGSGCLLVSVSADSLTSNQTPNLETESVSAALTAVLEPQRRHWPHLTQYYLKITFPLFQLSWFEALGYMHLGHWYPEGSDCSVNDSTLIVKLESGQKIPPATTI